MLKAIEDEIVDQDEAKNNWALNGFRNQYGRYTSLSKHTMLETLVFWAVIAICINLLMVLIGTYTGTTLPRLPDWAVLIAAAACVYVLFTTIMIPRGVTHGNFYGFFFAPSPVKKAEIEKEKKEKAAEKAASFGGKGTRRKGNRKRPRRQI